MAGKYVIDDAGKLVEAPDHNTWSEWMRLNDHRVAQDEVGPFLLPRPEFKRYLPEMRDGKKIIYMPRF